MFCPSCRGEFREGFFHCPDCDLDLVPQLPPEPLHDMANLAPLLTTSDLPFLAVVKSLLASQGIQCVVQGEESLRLNTILPSGGAVAPRALSSTVFVRQADLSKATQLVGSASKSE